MVESNVLESLSYICTCSQKCTTFLFFHTWKITSALCLVLIHLYFIPERKREGERTSAILLYICGFPSDIWYMNQLCVCVWAKSKVSHVVKAIVESQTLRDDETTAVQLYDILRAKRSLFRILRSRSALRWTLRSSPYCQMVNGRSAFPARVTTLGKPLTSCLYICEEIRILFYIVCTVGTKI